MDSRAKNTKRNVTPVKQSKETATLQLSNFPASMLNIYGLGKPLNNDIGIGCLAIAIGACLFWNEIMHFDLVAFVNN